MVVCRIWGCLVVSGCLMLENVVIVDIVWVSAFVYGVDSIIC